MMRPLTAKDIVSEVGPQTYAANEVTRIYASPAWDAGIRFSCVLPALFYKRRETDKTDCDLLA